MAPIDVYARVSRKGDKEQRSPRGQVQVCQGVLAGRGLEIGMVHVDDGRSAWNARVRREGWDTLMLRLESGAAGGVIVYELSRFSRRPIEGERLIAAAECGLLVLDSESEYDLTAANGRKQFRDMLSAAAYYSDDLSRKVRRGKKLKAMDGQVDEHRVFGFMCDGVTIYEPEAVWVRWAAEHLLHGDAQDSLVAHLNGRGVKTTTNGPWTPRGLRAMLTRPRNAGRIEHNGVVIGQLRHKPPESASPGELGEPAEPLIDPDMFDRVVAKYAARRWGRPASPKYVCSGLAHCGLCGKRLAGRPRVDRFYEDGEVKREYWCLKTKAAKGCAKISVDQRGLDAVARQLTIDILSDPRHAAMIEAAAADQAETLRELDAAIASDEALALALSERLGRGEMKLDRYDAAVLPLDKRLTELRGQRKKIAGSSSTVPNLVGGDWARRWDAGLPEERRELLRMALRGRVLIVGAADPADRANVLVRLEIGPMPGSASGHRIG